MRAARTLTVGSVYSGILGLDRGVSMVLRTRTAWCCDSGEYPRAVIRSRDPNVAIYSSDEMQTTGHLGCDLLIGGPPCQPTSHAGKKKGAADERWRWPQFLRLVREIRPHGVFVENPTALLTLDGGRAFGGILGILAELGYHAEWVCLRALDVGAPQGRERLFLLAHADGDGWQRLQAARLHAEGEARDDAHGRSMFPPAPADAAAWREVAERGDPEPGLRRLADGFPGGVVTNRRLNALGNATVPLQAATALRDLLGAP